MKLDNWQTKAERAAERRRESKEKKQQRDRTRLNKTLAQQLLAFLQEHNSSILSSSGSCVRLHLWTDAIPSNSSFRSILGEEDHEPESRDKHPSSLGPATLAPDKRKGRPRSNSYNDAAMTAKSQAPPGAKKGRLRSNSDVTSPLTPSSGRKSKGRPRSGSNASDYSSGNQPKKSAMHWSESLEDPLFCAHHFYMGQCSARMTCNKNSFSSNGRKSLDQHRSDQVPCCMYGWHTSAKVGNPTLAQILLQDKAGSPSAKASSGRLRTNQHAMESSLAAACHECGSSDDALSSRATSNPPKKEKKEMQLFAMDMLCHIHVPLPTTVDASAGSPIMLAELITAALSDNECSLGNLMYVALNDMLLFDRYQGGLTLSDAERTVLLYGGSKRRSISIGDYAERHDSSTSALLDDSSPSGLSMSKAISDSGTSTESIRSLHQRLVLYLPSQVLEYILTFLPISATATFPRVCMAWYNEIGRSSPDLWKHLMDRREWPYAHAKKSSSTPPISSQKDQISIYRETFIEHYTAVRNIKAIIDGIQSFSSNPPPASSANTTTDSSKDVATFDYNDTTGRPIRGATYVRWWSDARVLVGSSQDFTLHLYDIIDCSSSRGKRCKQSLRVSVAPFPDTRKRRTKLVSMDMDNQTVGCLFVVYDYGDGDRIFHDLVHGGTCTWLEVLQRDDLLCAGKGGNAVSDLEDGTLKTFDLTTKVLDFISSCHDDAMTSWLHNHVQTDDGLDLSLLVVCIHEHIIACGDGEFLFEASIIRARNEDEIIYDYNDRITKVFLFSSNFGEVTWISSLNGWYISTLWGPAQSLSDLEPRPVGAIHGAFISVGSTLKVVTMEVVGSSDVRCHTVDFESPNDHFHSIVSMNATGGVVCDFAKHEIHIKTGSDSPIVDKRNFLDRNDCLPIVSLGDDYLLAFGRGADSNHIDGRKKLLVRLYHVPSRKVIHEVTMKGSHNEILMSLVASRHCIFPRRKGLVALSVDEAGMFVAGRGVSSTENESWERKTKRKKGKKTKDRKDGFARGMRQSMG